MLLGQAVFANETASGWQEADFAVPVGIAPNSTYVAALYTTGGFSATWNYFTSSGVDRGLLHALRSPIDGSNRLYAYGGAPQFPTQSYADTNYWVDVALR